MSETNTITFEGLKGVGNVELNLRADQRVYAFIGTNGVGKTKVLEGLFQAFFFGNQNLHTGIQNRGATNQNDFVIRKVTVSNFYSISIPDTQWISLATLFHNQDDKKHHLPVVFLGANARGIISPPATQSGLIGKFEERRLSHVNNVLAAFQQQKFSTLGMDERISDWFVTRAQSANPYQKSVDNRKIEIDVLLKALNTLDNRIDDSFLQIDGANSVSLKINKAVVELKHLSSGFASLVKMLQAIIAGYANFTNETNITHVKGIVLIDEIESHLHIEWQAKIIPLLKELFPNTTFYVATHSALVLTQLQQGEAYLLKRDEADGVVRSEMIKSPDNQSLADLLNASFHVSINDIKKKQLLSADQSAVKQKMLAMLARSASAS